MIEGWGVEQREADTWGVHLLDAAKQGLDPNHAVAHAGTPLRAGQVAECGDKPHFPMSQAVSASSIPNIRCTGQAPLPTVHGEFLAQVYQCEGEALEHMVLSLGLDQPAAAGTLGGVLLRMHSECATGDLFGSLRCDCGPQLSLALERIAKEGRGLLIYLRGHEGRGIGLAQKLAAYQLQDRGLDTVDANRALGHPVDSRDYGVAVAILQQLGFRSVRLMSNNPRKAAALESAGIDVLERSAHEVPAQSHNRRYLQTKHQRMGHFLTPIL
ncbi:GTP cyclohydrolase II [Hydrogenophaga sp.]|uniref:GTP cyclohydrolase II n=1 Tax=Hydrogenophaga sp. TaxID=1904254 RepID=UPI0025C12D30|nr:GTP cyclohydrolase II [Hydrogenophaga sp.]